MDYLRRQLDESEEQFCHRICHNREIYGLSWGDVRDLLNTTLGKSYGKDKYRKQESRYMKKLNLYDERNDTDYSYKEIDQFAEETIEEQIFNLKKLKVEVSDRLTQENAIIRRLSRENTLIEMAKTAAETIGAQKYLLPTKNNTLIKDNSKNDKSALLLISDWHYGIDIDCPWNKYNMEIAKRRVAILRDKVIDKINFNNVKDLYVINLGDMIAGNIHLPLRLNSRIDVITQIIEVSEIIAEFLCDLSRNYSIHYSSVLDNHSRIDPNKSDSLQLESLARVTDWYLKERLKNFNIDFDSFDDFGPDMTMVNIFNHSIIGVHGDKDKPKTIIKNLTGYVQHHFDLICSAHLHHFNSDESNNTMLISNGSLMGTDQFASDLRLNSKPTQTLIICTKENVCDTIYRIVLD